MFSVSPGFICAFLYFWELGSAGSVGMAVIVLVAAFEIPAFI